MVWINTKAGRKLQYKIRSRIFGKGLLANSNFCLVLNETNCKRKKLWKSKKNMKSFSFLTTDKLNIQKIKVGARTKLEWYNHYLECEECVQNVRNTLTKTHSWFLKVKNKTNQEERINFTVVHSRHRKYN